MRLLFAKIIPNEKKNAMHEKRYVQLEESQNQVSPTSKLQYRIAIEIKMLQLIF